MLIKIHTVIVKTANKVAKQMITNVERSIEECQRKKVEATDLMNRVIHNANLVHQEQADKLVELKKELRLKKRLVNV